MATPTVGTTKEIIAHSIDYVAQKHGLYRFDDESLGAFRKRVLDVFVHESNASVAGFIYGASRQLGGVARQIGVLKPIELAGLPLAEAPGIQITNSHFKLYRDFTSSTLEKEFNIEYEFPRSDIDIAPYVYDIWNWVKSSSVYWEWDEEPNSEDMWLKADHIVPHQSYEMFTENLIVRGGVNYTEKRIVGGSVVSSNEMVAEEVTALVDMNEEGKFYVDYVNGYIYVYDNGSGEIADVNFAYYEDRVYLDWAPVAVQNLTDSEFVSSLMEIERSADNTDYSGIRYSKELGMLIIEAYRGDGTFWFAEDTNDTPLDIRNEYHVSDVLTDDLNRYYLDIKENLRELIREA